MEGDAVITVDTHVIIWNALKPGLLSKKAKHAIQKANETDGIIFCEISLWEISMLLKKKRIQIEESYLEFINVVKVSNKYIFHGITPRIADLSTNLPPEINTDPADRIICATSLILKAPLVTADYNLRKSKKIKTIW